MNSTRARTLGTLPVPPQPAGAPPVVYFMHRTHNLEWNWGFIHALRHAARQHPLAVVYWLPPRPAQISDRQLRFLLPGIREVSQQLQELRIPFFLHTSPELDDFISFLRSLLPARLVTDFDPLRARHDQIVHIASRMECAVEEVDSRNIVPCWVTSEKREYAARTIRPKIHRVLDTYLDTPPALAPLCAAVRSWAPELPQPQPPDWDRLESLWGAPLAQMHHWCQPGAAAGSRALETFVEQGLAAYHQYRNDPAQDTASRLSPYLHFGMITSQQAALRIIQKSQSNPYDTPVREASEGFIEQVVVRRELSDNFCMYTPEYTSTSCFPDWAIRTLTKHKHDPRPYVYEMEQLEQGTTHDPLWNAAQWQMVYTGYMHNYLRMYWAKKILEWSRDVETAMHTAIVLNDTYLLDGHDSNGYTGVAWSMGGVHDRGWREREIFGTIRYMNFNGARRKFNVQDFADQMTKLKTSILKGTEEK